jgi:hypothetical protein
VPPGGAELAVGAGRVRTCDRRAKPFTLQLPKNSSSKSTMSESTPVLPTKVPVSHTIPRSEGWSAIAKISAASGLMSTTP